jgi:sugar O-acyltransferase (sialic acid O-acetyltransferase NeuD family)
LTRLVIVGSSGFGREALDIVDAVNRVNETFDFIGFLDDNISESEELMRRDSPVLGGVRDLAHIEADYIIGIGAGELRELIDQIAAGSDRRAANAIHPSATIGADVELAPGAVVAAGARLTTNIRAGRHLQVHVNATVGHDCRLGACVTILPGANVSGDVHLEDKVTIGTGAAVLPGMRIGAASFVGAGAVVISDVPAGCTVVGVPARAIGSH